MKLRGIELQGFKSFADRTKLSFEDGITAIVGPNGSGKSNVSDAVKWVFGEQSVKSLRGAKMEDVIFGGTQTRKAQGYTAVSLTVENSNRVLDIDSDEVIITRKLYRSGESEYRVNNNPVRLKDIHEMFMDTGLGRDGYSIIEQGKIAEIVSAKSNQRREIFEEAAGISKFRYRKGEAERRLMQSEENLVRLRDIMGELEGRVAPLKAQADKAKQFLVVMEEKKSLEISLWLEKLEKLRVQLRELDDKLLISRSDRAAAQKQLDDIEEKLESFSKREQDFLIYIDRKRNEIRTLQEAVSGAQVTVAVKQNDISHNESAIEALEAQLAASTATAQTMDERIETLRKELAEYTDSLTKAHAALDELVAGGEGAQQNRLSLETHLKSLSAQREELRDSISRAQVSKETAETLVAETVARLETARSQTEQKDELLSTLKEEYRTAQSFAEELAETIEGLKNSTGGYEVKLSGRREKAAGLEARIRSLERSAGEKLQRAQLLTDMEQSMEGFSGSVKLIMKRVSAGALRGVMGTVSSLINVDENYATAIEIALGAAMQNMVVSDETVAKRAIAMLKEANAGRATFLPLSTIKGSRINEPSLIKLRGYINVASALVTAEACYSNIIESVLGRTIIAEDMDAAIAIGKACGNRYRVVTLDGQVINAGGSLTGGSAGKSGSILSRKNEIEALRSEAKELTEEVHKLEQQLTAIRQETAGMEALLEGINAEARTAGEDLIAANAECKRLSMALAEAKERNNNALAEIDLLKTRVEELRGQGLSSLQLIERMSQNLNEVETEIAATTQKRDALVVDMETYTQRLSEQQIALASLEKDCQMHRSALESLVEQKAGSASQQDGLRQQVEQLAATNRQLQGEIDAVAQRTAAGKEQINRCQQEIDAKQAERQSLEQQTAQLRREEKEASSRRETVSLELGRLEERRLSISTETDTIVSKMWDEYELARSEATQLAIPIADLGAAQRRLSELKNKLKNMGPINVAAIEEYKEVAERYEFMKTQIDDVERAKAELTKMITQLSAQMSNLFMEKFTAINANFSEIFVELFGGGKGELSLTDPSDPLETGIDIFVQPPGKIIKNLSALSGGEQAFVAICIYFAILKVSPAPFVLIDEIEAALDDVNVTRFAGYLRKMTEKTQFICITHRRGTMEEADVLYGVTMEEEGVSKLLRLNVSELEEKLKLTNLK
ncbi:MAG: chromosome segregation protein SMC [Angelakisella sp.]